MVGQVGQAVVQRQRRDSSTVVAWGGRTAVARAPDAAGAVRGTSTMTTPPSSAVMAKAMAVAVRGVAPEITQAPNVGPTIPPMRPMPSAQPRPLARAAAG